MQATSSNTAQNSYQKSQQDTQEDNPSQNREQTKHSNLNASVKNNSTKGEENDGVASDEKLAKKPVMASKPVKINLDVITSEVEKNQKTPTPISPRGAKPIPRLQLPETGQNPKSPRSPRSDQPRNVAESEPKSPGRDEIIKMADSVADAFRAFGSPRKGQPTPRRLESRRDLDQSLAERALEKTEISEKSATVATTTTTTTPTTTTTTTTTTATQDHIVATTDPQPATTMSSVATNKKSDNLAVQPQSDFSASLTQIDSESTMNFAYQNGGSGVLPDEPGYQPGQIFVKVRRKMSMPKVYAPISDRVAMPSVQPTSDVKYSKQAQIELLADKLVAECAGDSINPKDMGSINQNNAALDLNQLPAEFTQFSSYLRAKNKPTLNHLMHAIFRKEFESSEAWKKAIAVDRRFSNGGYGWTPSSGNFEGDMAKQLESMLQDFSDEFSAHIFGSEPTINSIKISEEFKNFLFAADKKFVEKLLDQDDRAARGDKGVHRLSKKKIDQFRAYFFVNILVDRFIKPMLLTEGRATTHLSMTMLRLELISISKAALALYKDFQKKSFENFPEALQKAMIKKSEDRVIIASIQERKGRFLQVKEGHSQRHMRSRSDLGVGIKTNPLEDKARIEYQKRNHRKQLESQQKKIDDQLSQILADLEMKELPPLLAKKIQEEKKTWFLKGDEVSSHAVTQNLLKAVRNLILDKKIDEALIKFEQRLSELSAESVESRAKRRATMPMNLGDLDFLNAILDQTISTDFSSALASTESTVNEMASTSSTTTTVTSTEITTTTIINPAVVTVQNSLPSTSESNGSGSQKNDLSKSTN
jgi:hypothetical protein